MTSLLHTERLYNNHLARLVQIVMARLLAHPEVISEEEVRRVFANLKVIRGYNMLLLSELEERLAHWHRHQCVGDIFVNMAMFFKTYTQFTDGLDRRREAFGIMRLERPELNRLCTEIEADPRLQKEKIYSLLLIPRERIHEYCVLLGMLDESTDPSHPDAANLRTALATLTELKQFMEDSNSRASSVSAFASIQKRLTGKKSQKVVLVVPGRELVKDDKMWKLKGGKMSERHVYLFNDMLLVTKSAKQKGHKGKEALETVVHATPLHECSVSPFRVDGEMRGVNVTFGTETECLYEGTPGEGEIWFISMVETLVKAEAERQRLLSPRGIMEPSSGDSPPVTPRPTMARTTSWSSLKRQLQQGRAKTPRGTSSSDRPLRDADSRGALTAREGRGHAHFSGAVGEDREEERVTRSVFAVTPGKGSSRELMKKRQSAPSMVRKR